MIEERQLSITTPRPLTISLFNKNNPKTQRTKKLSSTHTHNFRIHHNNMNITEYPNTHILFNNNKPFAQSAEYHRSIIKKSPKKVYFNPYTRIKKVDNKINDHKMKQQQLQYDNDKPLNHLNNYGIQRAQIFTPRLTLKSFRNTNQRINKKQIIYHKQSSQNEQDYDTGYNIRTLQPSSYQNSPKNPQNVQYRQKFLENYKNKIKISQHRTKNRKTASNTDNKVRSITPMKWRQKDTAKIQQIQATIQLVNTQVMQPIYTKIPKILQKYKIDQNNFLKYSQQDRHKPIEQIKDIF